MNYTDLSIQTHSPILTCELPFPLSRALTVSRIQVEGWWTSETASWLRVVHPDSGQSYDFCIVGLVALKNENYVVFRSARRWDARRRSRENTIMKVKSASSLEPLTRAEHNALLNQFGEFQHQSQIKVQRMMLVNFGQSLASEAPEIAKGARITSVLYGVDGVPLLPNTVIDIDVDDSEAGFVTLVEGSKKQTLRVCGLFQANSKNYIAVKELAENSGMLIHSLVTLCRLVNESQIATIPDEEVRVLAKNAMEAMEAT